MYPVVTSEEYEENSMKPKEKDTANLKFSILPATNPKKEMQKVERLAQQLESEKRRNCLARMRKEEETRGKAKSNKVSVWIKENNKSKTIESTI